jgi:hypothetical protein
MESVIGLSVAVNESVLRYLFSCICSFVSGKVHSSNFVFKRPKGKELGSKFIYIKKEITFRIIEARKP